MASLSSAIYVIDALFAMTITLMLYLLCYVLYVTHVRHVICGTSVSFLTIFCLIQVIRFLSLISTETRIRAAAAITISCWFIVIGVASVAMGMAFHRRAIEDEQHFVVGEICFGVMAAVAVIVMIPVCVAIAKRRKIKINHTS